jgi:hypothetical protein
MTSGGKRRYVGIDLGTRTYTMAVIESVNDILNIEPVKKFV